MSNSQLLYIRFYMHKRSGYLIIALFFIQHFSQAAQLGLVTSEKSYASLLSLSTELYARLFFPTYCMAKPNDLDAYFPVKFNYIPTNWSNEAIEQDIKNILPARLTCKSLHQVVGNLLQITYIDKYTYDAFDQFLYLNHIYKNPIIKTLIKHETETCNPTLFFIHDHSQASIRDEVKPEQKARAFYIQTRLRDYTIIQILLENGTDIGKMKYHCCTKENFLDAVLQAHNKACFVPLLLKHVKQITWSYDNRSQLQALLDDEEEFQRIKI